MFDFPPFSGFCLLKRRPFTRGTSRSRSRREPSHSQTLRPQEPLFNPPASSHSNSFSRKVAHRFENAYSTYLKRANTLTHAKAPLRTTCIQRRTRCSDGATEIQHLPGCGLTLPSGCGKILELQVGRGPGPWIKHLFSYMYWMMSRLR